jgi:hypothetical protein
MIAEALCEMTHAIFGANWPLASGREPPLGGAAGSGW